LAPYEISYKPRRAIKTQALADFIAKCSNSNELREQSDVARMLYIDRSNSNRGSGAGLTMVSPEGYMFEHTLKFMFKASNNEAEYEALFAENR